MKRFFKKYFLAGFAVVIPLVVTFVIIRFLIVWTDDLILSIIPEGWEPNALIGVDIPGFGFIATILIILLIGILTRNFIGNRIVALGDRIITKIPLGASIYNATKQFMNTFVSDKDQQFKGVVVVEYPRKNCWAMGFVTKHPERHILDVDGRTWVTIFVPTTPNPTSGYLIMVPEEDTRSVDISTEDAFKFIISAGYLQGNKD